MARMTAGLTQRALAGLAGLSQQEASKAEKGATDLSLDARCRLASACGHEIGWRLYPVATVRMRDSGQLGIAQAIVSAAHPKWRPQLEVPVAQGDLRAGDLRAADLLLTGSEEIIHVEIERALVDFQAQLRSAQLKREAIAAAEERPIRLVLAVPDTRTSRARLAPFAELTARTLPVRSARAWRAIRDGEPLAGDGIIFVRATTRG